MVQTTNKQKIPRKITGQKAVPHKSYRLQLIVFGMIICLATLVLCGLLYFSDEPQKTTVKPIDLGPIADSEDATSLIDPVPVTFTDNIADLLDATNTSRAENNVTPLRMNPRLNSSAGKKCSDMVKRDYWDHKDPDGQDPYHFFTESGMKYSKAAENLAFGYNNAKKTNDGWMASPSHRENLLNPEYTDVGFAVCESNDFIHQGHQIVIVQHFAKPA